MLTVSIIARTMIAQDICLFDLALPDGAELPEFAAGAHIDVHLPTGVVRQYSLCNSPVERHRYQIAVLKDEASRGGSHCLHERIAVADQLVIGEPRNLFPLHDHESPAILFAGGIGITPLLAMAEHLTLTGRLFSLHYCARSKDKAAFRDRIAASSFNACAATYFSSEGPVFDASSVLSQADPDAHLYVCGPSGFMDYVLETARASGWDEARLHREYFVAAPTGHDTNSPFTIRIARTGEQYVVPANKTAAQVLIENGFDIPLSCEQGICGTCLTKVLEGEPDHRDVYQTQDEQTRNDYFTPCCSRAKTEVLLLDL
jgi:vanillate O-demethylase ferredoxin subunit